MFCLGCRSKRIVAWLVWLAASPVSAQKPPDPDVAYAYPPVAVRGATTTVQLAGFDWTEDLDFFVLDPRVQMRTEGTLSRLLMPGPPFPVGMRAYRPPALPREITAQITVAAEAAIGPVRWQVANANGASNTGLLIIGYDPDVLENRIGDEIQRIEQLPVTVSGRISRFEEVDRYLVTAVADGLITCDLQARRLGSHFHGVIEVKDQAGQLLSDAVDTRGQDVELTWMARAGCNYYLSIRDLNFRGNRAYVYRMALSRGPRVVAALPAIGRRGETRAVELIGYGLSTGRCLLERIERTIHFPAEKSQSSLAWKGVSDQQENIEFLFPLSELPQEVVLNANETPELMTSATCSGRLDRLHSEERFQLTGKQGEIWSFSAEARSLGSPLDLALSVLDADGKELASNDDLPGTTDAAVDLALPHDGRYEIVVKDVSGTHFSLRNVYRLTAMRAEADFALSVPQHVNVPIGDQFELPVKVVRKGGFAGPVQLANSGLPTGITILNETVISADQTNGKILLQSSPDTPSGAALSVITGSAQIGDENRTHVALATAAGNLAVRTPEEARTEQVLIVSTLKPVVKIRPFETDERTAHRGTIHQAELSIERLGSFDGEVVVQMDSRQPAKFRQGVVGPDVLVPAGTNRVFYPCLIPEYAETNDAYRCLLVAMAKVTDARGRVRHLLSKMQADDASVAITVEGGLLKISTEADQVSMRAGETTTIPVKIARSAKLPAEVRLELRVPEEWSRFLVTEPVVVPAIQNVGVLRLKLPADAAISGDMPLSLRAIAFQAGTPPQLSESAHASPLDAELIELLGNGKLPVVAETTVKLRIDPARP